MYSTIQKVKNKSLELTLYNLIIISVLYLADINV